MDIFLSKNLLNIFKKLSTRPEIDHLLVRLVFFIERIISIKWASFLDILKVKILSTDDFILFLEIEQGLRIFFIFMKKTIEFVFI